MLVFDPGKAGGIGAVANELPCRCSQLIPEHVPENVTLICENKKLIAKVGQAKEENKH